jgi:hypothetical protein
LKRRTPDGLNAIANMAESNQHERAYQVQNRDDHNNGSRHDRDREQLRVEVERGQALHVAPCNR